MAITFSSSNFKKSYYSKRKLQTIYNPYYLPANQSIKNLSPNQSLDTLIDIFEKPMPVATGKKLLLQALSSPDIAKLTLCPLPGQIEKATRLSQLTKKYSLSAKDLDSNPIVRDNLTDTLATAFLRQARQQPAPLRKLSFGYTPNTTMAERLASAATLVTTAATANAGVCTFAPLGIDLCSTGLAAIAMGKGLSSIYNAKNSAWTVSTMAQVMTSIAVVKGPEYIITKGIGWLSNLIPGIGTASAAALEAGLSGTTMAAIGLGTIALFEMQIQAGYRPALPQDANSIFRMANIITAILASHGIGVFLSSMLSDNAPEFLGQMIEQFADRGGEELMQDIIRHA